MANWRYSCDSVSMTALVCCENAKANWQFDMVAILKVEVVLTAQLWALELKATRAFEWVSIAVVEEVLVVVVAVVEATEAVVNRNDYAQMVTMAQLILVVA